MKTILHIVLFISISFSSVTTLDAFTIEKHEGVPVENNFVVGPAKIEKRVEVGETQIVQLVVDNKTGRTQDFWIHFEDFVSGGDEQVVKLLGNESSNTTLKNFLSVEKKEFTLQHGDRAIIPVSISIPVGEKTGGKFGAVVVSAIANRNGISAEDRISGGAVVIGNIAALLFVTVPGQEKYDGSFVSLKTKENTKVFTVSEVPFRLEFRNGGNVSINPYGMLVIKNLFGSEVEKKIIDPWFVLPDSTRTRDISLLVPNGFGYYKALAQINRGYEDIVDEKEISFFIIPQFMIGISVLVLAFFMYVLGKKMLYRK